MLNLIKSNRMEHLLDALCTTLEQVPKDPMAAEWIGIQSRGMRQWLTTAIAGKFGICANVRFLFPRQILETLVEKLKGHTPKGSREALTWAVMDRLCSEQDWPGVLTGPGTPLAYVRGDGQGKKLWQISQAIAAVFDDYQVYRPDLLERWSVPGAWEKENPLWGGQWQAWLWQRLGQGETLLSGLSGLVRSMGNRLPDLPERISLFGVSALPPRYLEAFSSLAAHLDIHLFVLTPSDQFFFDLGSERQSRKLDLEGELPNGFEDTGSPLLRALGKSGREFHGILEQFDYQEPLGELFQDPGQETMLRLLQSDILNLVGRGLDHAPVTPGPQDRTVTLHACHSPMREAQVLKDQILDILDREPDLAPHDIIVMMPDIESYAPFLEAVFSQEPRLPFTVSDRRRRSESRTIEAFLKILELKESRLEKSRVMDVLLCPAVMEKFGLAPGETEEIAAGLARARVLWGRDPVQRQAVSGMGFEENTWVWGLSRLLLGVAMPEGEAALVGEVLPCDGFEGLEAETLGRFTHFAATLFRGLESLEGQRTPSGWAACLRRLALSMMAAGDLAFLLTALDDLGQEAERAGFDRKIPFPLVAAALTARLDQHISQGSFMAGSITLCNLMPMRSIPFRVVCLMGMGEKGFPRQPSAPGFDLMARMPRLGDKQVRDEDCYLFLESLLSARDYLVITYTGRSITDNSPMPCAGPVDVLRDTVDKSFVLPQGFCWVFDHPLHPFSPRYFNGRFPGFFSYSASQCAMAGQGAGQGERAWQVPAGKILARAELQDLISFFRDPARSFVRKVLGVGFPEPDPTDPDREPFRVTGMDRFSLGSLSLACPGDAGLGNRVKASGILPLGNQGQVEWRRIQAQADPVAQLALDLFPPEQASREEIRLQAGDLCLTGSIPDLFPSGRYVKTFGRLNPSRLLVQWIYHLAFSAALGPGPTCLVGRDPGNRAQALVFGPMDREKALGHLDTLARLYQKGQAQVLPFACTPCFYLVEALAKEGFAMTGEILEKAVAKARPFWTGSPQFQGQAQDRYTDLVMGGTDPFANGAAVRASGFLDTGLALFRPLMEGMAS